MKKQSIKDKLLEKRTRDIIEKGGRILLKRGEWYLSSWTNIAAGPDNASWARKSNALEIFNLKWAYAIAPLYGAKIVISYKKSPVATNEESICTIDKDGNKVWKNSKGQLHRIGGPAIEIHGYMTYMAYWVNDLLHREDGPAREWSDGTIEYWLNGKEYTYEKYKLQLHL